jgi:hypothetical protein
MRDVLTAEAKIENDIVGAWYEAAQTDWRAAAEFLARRFPRRWAAVSRTKLDINGVVSPQAVIAAVAATKVPVVTEVTERADLENADYEPYLVGEAFEEGELASHSESIPE